VNGIEVLAGGMLTTVQDLGRVGAQKYGVPASGAMDTWSLRAANRLAGNADGAAGLELTFVGPVLRFERDCLAALTGADLGPLLDGHPVALWRTFTVGAGSVLTFSGARDGLRGYLAVAGGIDVPVVMGSRSTLVRSALGGFEGRPLRAGDCLAVVAGERPAGQVRRLPRRAVPTYGHAPTIRVVLGPQDDAFTVEGISTFLGETYTMALQSDRIGCRFLGPPIAHRETADIVSDGTVFGSIQVAGDGMPIVLMADRGTTGGYTKIATVATVDLPRLAQAAPGDRVRFWRVGAGHAQALLRDAFAALDEIGPADPEADVATGVYEEDSGAPLIADGYVEFADALDGEHSVPDAARRNAVRAGMPGMVIAVAVQAGDHVTEGQTLVILEAMKMQNPVRAPRAGRVGRVHVSPGSLVGGGSPLVEIDDA
jgi:biotin-dependent carboxylase-like uncharacterized protein